MEATMAKHEGNRDGVVSGHVIAARPHTIDRFELVTIGIMIASTITFWFAH